MNRTIALALRLVPQLACVGLLAVPLSANALCTVLCSCSVSTTPVAFGSHNPLAVAAHDNTGNVRVTCGGILSLLVPISIALSPGANSSVLSPRKMASGANTLNYDLYTDNTYTTIWGTSGSNLVNGGILITILGGVYLDFPVYGRIPGNQFTVPPGSYTDTVVVTVTYQ